MLRKSIIVLALGLLLTAPATARQYFDGTMLVSPQLIALDYVGTSISIHTEVTCSDVVRSSVVLYGLNGASIRPTSIFSDSRGNLVAKFSSEDVRKIVEVPRTELTLTGTFNDGGLFSLRATVRVQ
jgi:hypothetical protein